MTWHVVRQWTLMSSLWHVHVIQASSGTTSTREPLYINNSSSASELSQLSTCPFESSPDQVDKILLKEQIKIMSWTKRLGLVRMDGGWGWRRPGDGGGLMGSERVIKLQLVFVLFGRR